ncbi:MAG: hypothetical protein KKG93_15710, partial [Bacteroidetes bacterium]|nr:hypothetical protein [Bacteroidota bacterium]
MRRIVVLIVIIQLFSNNLFAATGEGVSPVATFNSYFLVSSPNGSESWEASSSQNITWASLTTGKTLKLELSTDSGNSWSQITSGVSIEDKIYSWAVPGSPSDNCLIK